LFNDVLGPAQPKTPTMILDSNGTIQARMDFTVLSNILLLSLLSCAVGQLTLTELPIRNIESDDLQNGKWRKLRV